VLSSEEQAELRQALTKIAEHHGLNETPVD
jgi:hypothetical protein